MSALPSAAVFRPLWLNLVADRRPVGSLWLLGALSACSPPEASAPADLCPVGELAEAGACVAEACGTGTWGPLQDGVDVYVDATSTAQGDGSAAAPVQTIQAGADLAGALGGGAVGIAAGTYAENLLLGDDHRDVTLLGRCSALVTLDGSGDSGSAALRAEGTRRHPSVGLNGITVTGGSPGLWIQAADVQLSGVALDGNVTVGLLLYGGDGVLQDVSIVGTAGQGQGEGWGIWASGAATLKADHVELVENLGVGVVVSDSNTTASFTESTVRGTLPSGGVDGHGVEVHAGGSATFDRCAIDGNSRYGLFITGDGSSVAMLDSAVTGTLPAEDGFGRGVDVLEGATVSMTGTTVSGNAELGLFAATGATATLAHVTVEGNAQSGLYVDDASIVASDTAVRGNFGGLVAYNRGSIACTRCEIDANTAVGAYAIEGGSLTLSDSTVARTLPVDGIGGRGVDLRSGATATLSGCVIEANTDDGVIAQDPGTAVTLIDAEIRDTVAEDGVHGIGLAVGVGGYAYAERLIVQGSTTIGVFVDATGSEVHLVDSEISGTLQSDAGEFGVGVQVQNGAFVAATGSVIVDSEGSGLMASGGSASLEDCEITGTVRNRSMSMATAVSAEDGEVDAVRVTFSDTAGPGVYAGGRARVSCSECVIERSTFAGALVSGGVLSLSDTTISDVGGDAELGGGFDVYANTLFGSPSMTVLRSDLGPAPYAAVWLDGPGSYVLQDSNLEGSEGVDGMHGNAIFAENGVAAWDGTAGLSVTGCTLQGAAQFGVLLNGASATVLGNSWSENGIDLQQQACGGMPDVAADSVNSRICPASNTIVAYDLSFPGFYLPTVSISD